MVGVGRWVALVVLVAGAGCGDDGGGDGDGGGGRDGGSRDAGGSADGSGGRDGAGSDAAGPDAGETMPVGSITDHGITWTFDAPVEAGRFVTGDWYVVGPATVVAIDPAPGGGRNGSVLNVPPIDDRTGFDDRTEASRFDATLRDDPPIALAPGDRLVSSISMETPGSVENWLREGSGESSSSPVRSVSVLTCLASVAPADAFRPSYADPDVRLYRLGDVDRTRLPQLAPPSPVDGAMLEDFATRLGRPWIDNLYFGFDAQVDSMAMYGREMGRVAGIASLLLMLELPAEQREAQERLLIGFVQRGIDLWGLVRAGHPGWGAFGGHGSGRKWPIALAGLLVGDAEMASPSVSSPGTRFGEDMHTAYVDDLAAPADRPAWWREANVVYTGHQGVWDGAAVSDDPAWGPYEHLAPEMWLDDIGESYRRCCTSLAWVGQALAARLAGAEEAWAHDAFFDYADRWMDPAGDAEYTQAIYDRAGLDFRASWAAHGQAWDAFVEEMWAAYR